MERLEDRQIEYRIHQVPNLHVVPLDRDEYSLSALNREIAVQLHDASLNEAVGQIAERGGLALAYLSETIASEKQVSMERSNVAVSEALHEVLQGTRIQLMRSQYGQLVLTREAGVLQGTDDMLEPRMMEPLPQTGHIAGLVTDSTSGEPLPGVNVVLSGTNQGAATNSEGRFTISGIEPGTYDLQASFIGYATKRVSDVQVTADDTTFVDVALAESEVGLEEVEVVEVGYGTQQREYITGSVSSVQSDEFVQGQARDAAALLKGKVPGLVVTEPGSNPTGGSEIRMRGVSSLLGSSDPLVLIDGVPGDLKTVAPEMIASVNVLKSGAAAAIYGSRASNGVILITTKENQGGQLSIQYSGELRHQRIYQQPNFLDAEDYPRLIEEGYGFTNYGHNTNWQDEVLRNPVSHTHDLTLTGGNSETNYLASLNYENTEGIFLRSDNQEAVGRLRVNHSMFDNDLQADVNLIGRYQSHWNGFDPGYWRQALIRNPTDRIKNDEGTWQERNISNYYNPLGLIHESNGEDVLRELRLNGTLTWSPIEVLDLELTGSRTNETLTSGYAETHEHISTKVNQLDGFARRSTSSIMDDLLELTGTYEDEIGGHSFNVLGGYSYQRVESENYNMTNHDFPTDVFSYNSMQNGNALSQGKASMNSHKQAFKVIGFFSRVNYSWNDRYILMASLRYEGNSKFGADHKWGTFPAFSVGWRLGEESFMEDVSFVNELKIRGGYGITGIAPTQPYQSLTSFEYGSKFLYQGDWVQGVQPARNPNPDLRWERKKEINLGLDFTVFNRLKGSVDVYRRTTEDMLWNYDVPVPPYLYQSITANVGEMKNEGLEVGLEYAAVQREDFNWTTSVNYSTNSNELVSLSNDLFETTNDYFDTGYAGDPIQMSTHRVEVGKPIGMFYGWDAVDIDENGEWIVLDNEGNRTPIDELTLDHQRYIGNGIPDHHLSWNHNIRYKDFNVQVNMSGAFGHQILNFTRMHHENPSIRGENLLEDAFDPIYGKRQLSYPLTYTDYYIEDGDYWKIDNVTVGYNLKVESLDVVSSARVYLSGQNLWIITGYDGIDPEVSTTGLTPGSDRRYQYPNTRTYTFGVNLKF